MKQRLANLVGLQPAPDPVLQVQEAVAAHRQLFQVFEMARLWIPEGQLLELEYSDLVQRLAQVLRRIYDRYSLPSWPLAAGPIRAGIDQARRYRANPVQLPERAEQQLRALLNR